MNSKYSKINITSQDDYIKRVNHQIDWLDKKSVLYKRYYSLIKVLILLLTSSITIISALGTINLNMSHNSSIIIIFLAPTIAFLETILQLFQFEKLHYLYRTTSENLLNAKIIFQIYVNFDNNNEIFISFVNNCENLLANNNINWHQIKNENEVSSG